jgi:hypothetical protein
VKKKVSMTKEEQSEGIRGNNAQSQHGTRNNVHSYQTRNFHNSSGSEYNFASVVKNK